MASKTKVKHNADERDKLTRAQAIIEQIEGAQRDPVSDIASNNDAILVIVDTSDETMQAAADITNSVHPAQKRCWYLREQWTHNGETRIRYTYHPDKETALSNARIPDNVAPAYYSFSADETTL